MNEGAVVLEAGALREWQRQLRAGERTPLTFDPLWRAACAEANAREWAWCPRVCNEYRVNAAAILVGAAEHEAAST